MSNQILDLQPGRLTSYARELGVWRIRRDGWRENDLRAEVGLDPIRGGDRIIKPMVGGMASFSDYLELKMLDYIFNDPNTAFISADPYLGLWTSALTDASTGATAGEAAYTTYARAAIANASMSAAASGSKTNSTAITFAACTASSAIVTYWCTVDSVTIGAGNVLVWGTCTSTTVDTSHTPPTVAIGGLVVTLD